MHRVSLLAATCLLSLSAAAPAAQRPSFDLPGGRLGDAAVALGRTARISIGIRDPAIAALRVRPVRGARSTAEALRRMLAGTGARAVPVGPGAWVIVRAPVTARRHTPAPRPQPEPAAAPQPPLEQQQDIVVTGSKRRILLAAYPGAATLVDGRDPAFEGLRGSDALVEKVAAVTSTSAAPITPAITAVCSASAITIARGTMKKRPS